MADHEDYRNSVTVAGKRVREAEAIVRQAVLVAVAAATSNLD